MLDGMSSELLVFADTLKKPNLDLDGNITFCVDISSLDLLISNYSLFFVDSALLS